MAIGVAGAFVVSPLLIPLVLVGAFLVPAYNLELAGGRFHTDLWFALAWGGFPAFTGYFAQTLCDRPGGRAGRRCLLPAERRPAPAQHPGARAAPAHGVGHRRADARRRPHGAKLTKATIAAPLEGALSSLWLALALLAAGLLAVKL